jgi:hypothetical protein
MPQRNTVDFMLNAWTVDDLDFALVRALHFGSAKQVADELLAAADHPATSLDGVTPRQARLRAAGVLSRTGNYAEANTVLRNIQASDPASGMALACAFAEAGEAGEAETLARGMIEIERGSLRGVLQFTHCMALTANLASSGYFDRALHWADEAMAVAGAEGGPAGRKMVKLAEAGKNQLLGIRRDAAADGIYDAETMRMHRQQIATQAVSHRIDMPPWPSIVDGCLLWWPESEYQRLIRQLPGLGEVIGTPWRGHTARVESELATTKTAVAHKSLVVADFGQFITFLEESGADPLAASTMAAFTESAKDSRSPDPWPPRPRRPCWCRSGKRYQSCCGKQSATA